MDKIKKFYNEHKELCYLLFLAWCCIMFIFSNIGIYPLIDIDETRYVNMSRYMYLTKEYLTPILNFEPFLEKPPLYFWLNVISFKIFGYKSIFAARFMTGAVGSFIIFYTYFFAKTILKSRLYGFLSANVLLASAWFLVFTHVAILDLNFMAFSAAAIYSAVLPLFIEKEKNKKYCWYFGYLFMALSVLAKGFIGLAVPCITVFFTYLFLRKVKELFKPIYILPGVLILVLVALPWHILIYQAYNQEWVNMYILKHHFARLLNSEGLGRKQPFLFYVPIVLAGLIPWTFNFIVILIRDIKRLLRKIRFTKSLGAFFVVENDEKKAMAFCYIFAICVFLFFSTASTKLPPYILTMFPALALIVGHLWYKAIKEDELTRPLRISNYINATMFLVLSFLGLIFAFIYKPILPNNIEFYVTDATIFAGPLLLVIFLISLRVITLLKKASIFRVFLWHLALMLCAVYVTCDFGIPYYTSFAQDELEQYAQFINEQKNSKIVTYGFSAKYSILNPKKKIKYIVTNNKDNYDEMVEYIKKNKKNNVYILTRIKVQDLENKKEFKKIKEGKVYRIYVDTLH